MKHEVHVHCGVMCIAVLAFFFTVATSTSEQYTERANSSFVSSQLADCSFDCFGQPQGEISLTQWFSNISMHQNQLEDLLKYSFLGLNPEF